jgi:hypothetical protein
LLDGGFVLGADPAGGGIGRGLHLRQHVAQVRGRGVDGAADLGQGDEEALTRGVELLDLGARHLPAPAEVVEHAVAGPLRLPDQASGLEARLLLDASTLLLRIGDHRFGPCRALGEGLLPLPRDGFDDPPGLVLGLAEQLGGPDLGGRHELGGLRLGGLGRRHPHEEGAVGLGDGEEEGLDLAGVEAAEVGAEGAAGDVVRGQRGVRVGNGHLPDARSGPHLIRGKPPAGEGSGVPRARTEAARTSSQQPTTNGQVR